MSHPRPARISLYADPPAGVAIAEVVPADCRLVAGLESGPETPAAYLGDDIRAAADRSSLPLVLDMRGVDWIDSGACAVLIKVWKTLRQRGQPLVLCVTDPVGETFKITGLIRLIPCFPNLEAAAEAARTAGKSA
jgi:anti-anti-sigma factor